MLATLRLRARRECWRRRRPRRRCGQLMWTSRMPRAPRVRRQLKRGKPCSVRARAWYFYDAEARDEATWDRPSGSCVVHWHAPAVPQPWLVRRDDVTGELSFWNEFYVEDGCQTGKLQKEVPSELPPKFGDYEARRAADGC